MKWFQKGRLGHLAAVSVNFVHHSLHLLANFICLDDLAAELKLLPYVTKLTKLAELLELLSSRSWPALAAIDSDDQTPIWPETYICLHSKIQQAAAMSKSLAASLVLLQLMGEELRCWADTWR